MDELEDIINNPGKQKISYNPHDATWETLKLVNEISINQIFILKEVCRTQIQLQGFTGQELEEKTSERFKEKYDKIIDESERTLNKLLQKMSAKYHKDVEEYQKRLNNESRHD